MDDEFEARFEEALTASGESYRAIRSEILDLNDAAAERLAEKMRHDDWEVRLQAEILTGWHREPERYGFIRRVARGTEPSLEGEKYLTGRPPVGLAARTVIQQGEWYLPALLELLYKEPDRLDNYVLSVSSKAVTAWDAREAVPVYRSLLLDPDIDPAYRELSIQPLLAFEAEGRFDDLLAVYEEAGNPLALRAAALATLGRVDAGRSLALLEDVLTDGDAAPPLRAAAALGLGETGNTSLIGVLVGQYEKTEEGDVKESILQALAALDDPAASGPLEELRASETDSAYLELIDEILEDLEE